MRQREIGALDAGHNALFRVIALLEKRLDAHDKQLKQLTDIITTLKEEPK